MQCSCGADTKPGSATTSIKGTGRYTLSFQVCTRCGRVGGERLDLNGLLLDSGIKARGTYQRLETYETPPAHEQVESTLAAPQPVDLAALLTAGNQARETWPKPVPERTTVNERVRKMLICEHQEQRIEVLYMDFLYDQGRTVYVPLLDRAYSTDDEHCMPTLLEAFRAIKDWLQQRAAFTSDMLCSVVDAPPTQPVVAIAGLQQGELPEVLDAAPKEPLVNTLTIEMEPRVEVMPLPPQSADQPQMSLF